jgi:hypothetical protein
MAKPAINRKKTLFTRKLNLHFKEETSKVLHLDQSILCYRNLDTLDNRLEIAEKFWNVVLEKDGEDQFNRTCENWRNTTQSRGQ